MTRLRARDAGLESGGPAPPGRPRGGGALAAWAVVLGALFPAYLFGAVLVVMGIGLVSEDGDHLLVTGWPAVPRLLVVLLFQAPLLLGMWLGVRAYRQRASRTRRVAIWLNGFGLLAGLFLSFLSPLEDAFMEGPTPGFSVRAFLIALVLAGLMTRAALRAATGRIGTG